MALEETGCAHCWENLIECTCDVCGKTESHHGNMEKVTQFIRKNNWKTIPGKRSSDPMQWACASCKKQYE